MEVEEGGAGWEGAKEWEGACASLPQILSVRKDGKKTRFQKTANKLCTSERLRACGASV